MEVNHSGEVVVVREDVPLSKKLPPEFLDELLHRPDMSGQFLKFMKEMLSTGKFADVTFVLKQEVEDGGDQGGEPVFIKAHTKILKTKSEFFATLFSDRWTDTQRSEQVDLTGSGIAARDFRCFLEFLYTDQIQITNKNVMILYHVSDMYQVDYLKIQCEEFLAKDINEKNVFQKFDTVFTYDHSKKSHVLAKIMDYLRKLCPKILDCEEFLKLDAQKLRLIFRSGRPSNCRPLQLARFCLRWAKRTHGDDVVQNPAKVREIIQDELCVYYYDHEYAIPSDFRNFLRYGRCSILEFDKSTATESKSAIAKMEFSVSRFPSHAPFKRWVYRRGRADRISFRVSEAIYITGIGLYGAYGSERVEFRPATRGKDDYTVDLKIYIHGQQHRELVHQTVRHTADSDANPYLSKTFKINLTYPTYIHPHQYYTISAKIEGPDSHYGEDGEMETFLRCARTPLIFEFDEASTGDAEAVLSNPTGVPIGQIPKIYFKLAPGSQDDDIKMLE